LQKQGALTVINCVQFGTPMAWCADATSTLPLLLTAAASETSASTPDQQLLLCSRS
jgi:hypothetical protein